MSAQAQPDYLLLADYIASGTPAAPSGEPRENQPPDAPGGLESDDQTEKGGQAA